MLTTKTNQFVDDAKRFKKGVHKVMMNDGALENMSDLDFTIIQAALRVIDSALELVEERTETLKNIDGKLSTLLEKIED